jgi:glutaredoxin
MADRVRVFWVPGCTSCLRTKEFLTSRGVDYESIDVQNDPDGAAQLERLGARGLPVVAIGDRWVFAQSTRVVAEFVGVPLGGLPPLPPAELAKRMDKILAGALRFAAQIPASEFDHLLPKRKRTYADLAWHIFRIADSFLISAEGGVLTFESIAESKPDDIRTTDDIVAFGSDVRNRVLDWWERTKDQPADRLLKTFYGDLPLQEVMERSTWHSGQHSRQLMMVLEELGIEPASRLGIAEFHGLPMPVNIWDDKLEFTTKTPYAAHA